jgi:hydrogenase nickel incorporation protein HypA/HybF
MHEYSIVDALIQRVAGEAARANAVAVHKLHVRIGELAGVETELLRIAYDTFREGTICAGAELALTPVAARWHCPSCGRAIARGARLQCPECALPARLEQGDEIILDRIELEVA